MGEHGSFCTDNYDDDINEKVTTNGVDTIDVNTPGLYYVNYVACDQSNNCNDPEGSTVTITVVDTTPPVVHPAADATIEASSYDAQIIAGTCTDTCDVVDETAEHAVAATVNPGSVPDMQYYCGGSIHDLSEMASANTIDGDVLDEQCGGYAITYTCKDIHGNDATAKQHILVQDTTDPSVTVEEFSGPQPNFFAQLSSSSSGSFALVFCGALVGALVVKSSKTSTNGYAAL